MIPELETKVTMLAKIITSKWYRSLHELAEESKTPYMWVIRAVQGKEIPEAWAKHLTEYLDSL